jgi:hypothetical protein
MGPPSHLPWAPSHVSGGGGFSPPQPPCLRPCPPPSKESFCSAVVVIYQIKSNVARRSCGNLKCARFQAGDNHSRQSAAGHITRCENGDHRSNGCRFVGSRKVVLGFRTPSVSADCSTHDMYWVTHQDYSFCESKTADD